jgi:hypothetical protein
MQDSKTLPLTDEQEHYPYQASEFPEGMIPALLLLLVVTVIIIVLLSLKHPIRDS